MSQRIAERPVVEAICVGEPRDMGLSQGVAARDKIASARRALAELEAFRRRQPVWMPYHLYRWMAEQKAARFLSEPLSRDYPAMASRLTGIAEGSGIGLNAAKLLNAMEPMLSAVGGCTACPGACSALAVRGSRSATGEPILVRNFDYLPMVQPFYTVRESRPTGKLRSLDFTIAPLAGAVDGINEAGLCIAYNYAFTIDGLQTPAGPISMAISEALENCTTVSSAADFITAKRRCGGGLLMMCDADGDIASLELSSTRSHLHRPSPGEDHVFHTNAFGDPAMRQVQIPIDAVYTDAAPAPLRGRRLHMSSEQRDGRFRELLKSPRPLSLDDLTAVMADHGPTRAPNDFTICMHGTYWHTTCCLQLFPKSRTIRVAYDTACKAAFREAGL